MEATFNDIDALVLSVIYQNNQLDLVKWIGMIDFYERIILTFEELRTSLQKLQQFGLIKFSEGEFLFSSGAVELFGQTFHIRNYEKIYHKLLKKAFVVVSDDIYLPSKAEYTEALNKYQKMANGFYS